MAQKHRFNNSKRRGMSSSSAEPRGLRRPPEPTERIAPVVYGKPFIVLEDDQKNTFIYKAGNWIPHSASIAECRQACLVKELPQRVNRMVRYEVRSPLTSD
jgi:hypothetical protein